MSLGPALGGFLATWSYGALFVVDGLTSLARGGDPREGGTPRARCTAGGAGTARVAGTPPAHRDRRLLLLLLGVLPVAVVFFQHVAAMALFLVRDLGCSEASVRPPRDAQHASRRRLRGAAQLGDGPLARQGRRSPSARS